MWLETIENEEDTDHRVVSLFCHLHHVTQNCANINNTDQIFSLILQNNRIFYDDDDNEHLPIPVYSGIKPSMRPEFILNTLLSLGIFSTERELLLNNTLSGCFHDAKLIGEEYDLESLHNYSNRFMNILVNNKLVFYPNGL